MDRGIYPEEVGKYTYGHEHIKVKDFEGGEKLKIGKFCSIADKVTVFLGGNHKTERITTYPFESMWKEYFDLPPETHLNLKNTIIGNDVWIGHGVTIMPGVEIGDGSVIAANSHVVKNVAPYTIVGGNPARFIRGRFNEDSISKLLEVRWWDLPEEKIKEILPYICSSDVNRLIKFLDQ